MHVVYLFDIDGTLLHAKGSGRAAFDAVFVELHGIANASEGIRYGGKTDHAIIDEIFVARLGRHATQSERDAFIAAYLPKLRALLLEHPVEVLEGVLDALEFLSKRPEVVLGIATGNVKEGAYAKLGAAQLEGWFVFGGYGCDSHVRAELVAKAAERAKHERDVREVIVVGDTIHDISAARAVGATVCAVATGSDTRDALAHADVVFDSLVELPAWHAARFG